MQSICTRGRFTSFPCNPGLVEFLLTRTLQTTAVTLPISSPQKVVPSVKGDRYQYEKDRKDYIYCLHVVYFRVGVLQHVLLYERRWCFASAVRDTRPNDKTNFVRMMEAVS